MSTSTRNMRSIVQLICTDGAVLAVIVAWWLWSRGKPSFVVPSPVDTARELLRFFYDPTLMMHAGVSFVRVGITVVAALLIATVIGLLVRAFPVLEETVERRLLVLLNSVPSIGWAILGILWFQVSNGTIIFIQIMIVLPFCLINIIEGLRNINPEYVELGRSFTRSPRVLMLKLILPLCMPFVVAAARISYGVAWKVSLVAELFGAQSGLGFLLMQAQNRSDAPLVFACCLVIVIIFGVVDWYVLRPLGRRYSVSQEQ